MAPLDKSRLRLLLLLAPPGGFGELVVVVDDGSQKPVPGGLDEAVTPAVAAGALGVCRTRPWGSRLGNNAVACPPLALAHPGKVAQSREFSDCFTVRDDSE